MNLTNRLQGQVALITGGGGEIGTAIALRLAAEGSAVVVGDLELDKAEATAQKVIAQGGRATAAQVDVSDAASCEAIVAFAMTSFQKLTTLVNVAATVLPDGTVETLSLEQWNKAIGVNLTGAFLMCKYGVPHMRAAGGGSIINIASQLGHVGVQHRAPYCTTKAALIFFTQILAQDHAPDNIRANSISPGFILTRPGEPEEIAAGAAFLASSDASFVTGTDLLMDGGYVTFKGRMTPEGKTIMT